MHHNKPVTKTDGRVQKYLAFIIRQADVRNAKKSIIETNKTKKKTPLVPDIEYESQFVFPNGFVDQNGIYYVNSELNRIIIIILLISKRVNCFRLRTVPVNGVQSPAILPRLFQDEKTQHRIVGKQNIIGRQVTRPTVLHNCKRRRSLKQTSSYLRQSHVCPSKGWTILSANPCHSK